MLDQIRAHNTTLIFHNTRAQAEVFFRNLWLANADALPIGIHHGSLDRVQRDRVEAAMVRGDLRAYDRWQRLLQRPDQLWQLRDPRATQRIRMNIGTIQDSDTLKVRLRRSRGGKPLGEIEESFAASLPPGDTFLIGGQMVRMRVCAK